LYCHTFDFLNVLYNWKMDMIWDPLCLYLFFVYVHTDKDESSSELLIYLQEKQHYIFWVGSDNFNVDDRIVAFVYTSIILEFSVKFVLFGCSVILCVWPTDSGNACNCKNYFLSHKVMFWHANSLPLNFLEYLYKTTQSAQYYV
jgi:hypothetical protein